MTRHPVAVRLCLVVWSLGAALVSIPFAAAQNGEELRVTAGVGHRLPADIGQNGGEFSETRFGLTAARAVNLNERWRLEPVVGYRFSAYDFSGAEPWEDIHQARITALLHHGLNEKWTVFGGPSIGFAAESGANASEAFTLGGAVGATYKVTERLTLGGGVAVTSEIEDDPRVRPLLILYWQANDQWSVECGYFDVVGGLGLGAEVRYQISQQWKVTAGGQYQESRYRLAEDGPVRDGVGEDSFFPIYAKVTWQASKSAAIELLGGVSVGGELRLENRRGQKISEEDYDPAALFGLRAVLTF